MELDWFDQKVIRNYVFYLQQGFCDLTSELVHANQFFWGLLQSFSLKPFKNSHLPDDG